MKDIRGGPIIFAANHLSFADGPLSGASVPKRFLPVHFLAAELFFHRLKYFPVAVYLWLNGCLEVKKEPHGNLPVILSEAVENLKAGHTVWIFPEGKRSLDGKLQSGRRGAAFLHQETGAPIVPVAISGTYRFFSFKKIIHRSYVTLAFGRPIINLEGGNLDEKTASLMSKIKEMLE